MYIAMYHFKFMQNKQYCINVIALVHWRLDEIFLFWRELELRLVQY